MAPVLSHTVVFLFLLHGDHDHCNYLPGFEIKCRCLGVFHRTLQFISTATVSTLPQRTTFGKTSWKSKDIKNKCRTEVTKFWRRFCCSSFHHHGTHVLGKYYAIFASRREKNKQSLAPTDVFQLSCSWKNPAFSK